MKLYYTAHSPSDIYIRATQKMISMPKDSFADLYFKLFLHFTGNTTYTHMSSRLYQMRQKLLESASSLNSQIINGKTSSLSFKPVKRRYLRIFFLKSSLV